MDLATKGSADLLQRSSLGRLAVGSVAGLALFQLDEPRFSGVDEPLAGLVLSGASRVSHLMIDGEWKIRDRMLLDCDLQALQAAHHQQALQLISALH